MIMKKTLLVTVMLSMMLTGFAQTKPAVQKAFKDYAVKTADPILETNNFSHDALEAAKSLWPPAETDIGDTYYDNQTNASSQTRLHYFDDGTAAGVWIFGVAYETFPERGTGYNYFDGSAWGPFPGARIEPDRTGWPAIDEWGETGEIIMAHYSGAAYDGLIFSTRVEKGTGDWLFTDCFGPSGHEGMVWPRLATGGVNHSVIHQIAMTRPVANGGTIYEGLDGALLYSRSADGATTWDIQNELLEPLTSTYFTGIDADAYEIIADGDYVAILYGAPWMGLDLLKSTDGGDNWTHTNIWEHPYPLWVSGTPTDTFYCADGAHHLAFDQSHLVHVVFGINRAYADATSSYWFPLVDGVGYWNENRSGFSSDLDALCPYSDCAYSELVDDYSLIGWAQDVNENGTWDILGEVGAYYLGASSWPQIVIDDMNRMFVTYSSVTETYNNGNQDYRHIWCRTSPNGDWWGAFSDLTGDIVHIFDECVFPSSARNSDDYFCLLYQSDNEPGGAVRGDLDPFGQNFMRFMKVLKEDVWTGIKKNDSPLTEYDVLQNYPNPAAGSTTVKVNLHKPADLKLRIVNKLGQQVLSLDAGHRLQGMNEITFDVSGLAGGVYCYTVIAGETSISKKMIVE
jgi:hypothetical protein